MSKLSISELKSGKLSKHLIHTINTIKGGSESGCHPSSATENVTTRIINPGSGG